MTSDTCTLELCEWYLLPSQALNRRGNTGGPWPACLGAWVEDVRFSDTPSVQTPIACHHKPVRLLSDSIHVRVGQRRPSICDSIPHGKDHPPTFSTLMFLHKLISKRKPHQL